LLAAWCCRSPQESGIDDPLSVMHSGEWMSESANGLRLRSVRQAGPVSGNHAVRAGSRRDVGNLAIPGPDHDPVRCRDLPGRRQTHDRQSRRCHGGPHDRRDRGRAPGCRTAVSLPVRDRGLAGAGRPALDGGGPRGDAVGRGAHRQQDQRLVGDDPAAGLAAHPRPVGSLPYAAHVPVRGRSRRGRGRCAHGPDPSLPGKVLTTTRNLGFTPSACRSRVESACRRSAPAKMRQYRRGFDFPNGGGVWHEAYFAVLGREETTDDPTRDVPDASADLTQRWFADNPSAAVMIGVCQLLSVTCLGGFAVSLRQGAATAGQVHAARKARPWGLLAVACMALSSLLGWLLTAFAAGASLDTVAALRTASFIAGGTAHVIALGVFVLLASRIPGFGKPVRVFAIVASVPAIASLVSLAWFQGAALILLGRLLCIAWVISAAVSAT